MKKESARANRTLLVLAVFLLALFLVSFWFGRYGVDIPTTCRILLSRIFPLEKNWDPNLETAVANIRLPRILLACLVGCCLSTAGAAYQGVFQNPMASPDILGASAGAAFGAALAILLGADNVGITISAFSFSLGTVALVYLIGQRAQGKRILNLVLAGMVVSSLFNAGTSYLKLVADPSNQLPAITYWLMGSLSGVTMKKVLAILPVMALGLVPLFLLRWKINLLTLGDEEAQAMGVHPTRLRFVIVICATLVTSASISAAGTIGWVGLVIPHLCRKLTGSNFKKLLPAAMLAGAAFLLLVDDLSRNLLATEIPIGILTAFIGAPFFLYMLLRKEGVH